MERYEKGFDNKEHLFHRLLRKHYSVVLAVDKEKEIIYIGKQEQPSKGKFYNFIGGIIERGEDPLASAKRELLEETGMKANDWKLYKEVKFKGGREGSAWIYIANNCKKITGQNLDEGTEKLEVMEVTLDELIDLYHSPERKGASGFALDMQRLKLDPKAKEEFRKKMFE